MKTWKAISNCWPSSTAACGAPPSAIRVVAGKGEGKADQTKANGSPWDGVPVLKNVSVDVPAGRHILRQRRTPGATIPAL